MREEAAALLRLGVAKENRAALLCTVPLGFVQPAVLLMVAWRLQSYEACGRLTLSVCNRWEPARTSYDNCLRCGTAEPNSTDWFCLQPGCGS